MPENCTAVFQYKNTLREYQQLHYVKIVWPVWARGQAIFLVNQKAERY
jgi:hypothetical protein